MSDMVHQQPNSKHILLTGASGALGRMLTPHLAQAGYRLRLSDINVFPDEIPEGSKFILADLTDKVQIRSLMQGIDCVLHFGGISTEKDFEDVLQGNIIGCTHLFEAAKAQKARVVFASSNHAIGFYPRGENVTVEMPYQPDGYYGLSKAYGELLGKLFFTKHGLESVHLRIGSCLPEPSEARHLATWLSYPDLLQLVQAAIEAPETGFSIVWGVSNNARSWWQGDDRERIGYQPLSNAETFADKIVSINSDDPITEHFQGGSFCTYNYSRKSVG